MRGRPAPRTDGSVASVRFCCERQGDRDRRADADLADHPDHTAVGLDEASADGQAEPGSVRVSSLVESIEHGSDLVVGDPCAVVDHLDPHRRPVVELRAVDRLDMVDTGFIVPEAKRDRFAANYTHNGGKLVLKDKPTEAKYAENGFFSGGGGLVGTARDYARFLQMVAGGGELQGERILNEETVKLMTSNGLKKPAFPIGFGDQVRDNIGYGLGFAVCTAKSKFDPARPVGEYGWGGAASTHYWCSPADKLFVVTLEQRMPYTFETEWKIKPLIYEALEK